MNTKINIKIIRFILLAIAVIICHANSSAQYNVNAVKAYIQKFTPLALENEKNYGVPASITLAQAILESRAGASSLTRASNNHFGIKKHKDWKGKVYYAQDDEPQKSAFRCYSSAEESYRDYAKFLSDQERYRSLFRISKYNYREWAFGLKRAGYATATDYATALIGIIDYYKLYAVNGGVKLHRGKQKRKQQYIEIEEIVYEDTEEYEPMDDNEESEEETDLMNAIRNYVVEINDIPCTVIMPGEELSHIASDYDLSIEKILEFNEITSPSQLKSGDIIFLDKKKKKYNGAQDFYTARGGETLYYVSQQYGIQLGRLAKLNGLNQSTYLDKGACLKLK